MTVDQNTVDSADQLTQRQIRTAFLTELIERGVPAITAAEITDLAMHATETALAAIAAVAGRASHPVIELNVLLMTKPMVELHFHQVLRNFPEVASQVGCETWNAAIDLGRPS